MKIDNIFSQKLPHLNLAERITLRIVLFLFKGLITVYNDELLGNIKDPVIFVFNHNSRYETLLLGSYLIFMRKGKKVSFLIDWMFKYLPIAGWIMNITNPVYVYNKPSTIRFLNQFFKPEKNVNVYDQCSNLISENESIGIFPEGSVNRDTGFLKKGKSGAARIVLNTNAGVVPIGIDFPNRAALKNAPTFGPLIFRIGKRMDFSDYYNLACGLKTSGLPEHGRISEEIKIRDIVTYKIMCEISRLSGKVYPYELEGLEGI